MVGSGFVDMGERDGVALELAVGVCEVWSGVVGFGATLL